MKRQIICLLSLSILTIVARAQEKQWDKYIPEKQRRGLIKKSSRGSGMGALMAGQNALATWITEPIARVYVSEKIDKERISNDEAQKFYQSLRSQNYYIFAILTFSGSPGLVSARASTIGDPLARNEIFLQRKDNNKIFSKGEAPAHDSDFIIGGYLSGSSQSTYIVLFPKTTREGGSLVQDLNEKIEIQFRLAQKKVVLEFKLKDFTSQIDEL